MRIYSKFEHLPPEDKYMFEKLFPGYLNARWYVVDTYSPEDLYRLAEDMTDLHVSLLEHDDSGIWYMIVMV